MPICTEEWHAHIDRFLSLKHPIKVINSPLCSFFKNTKYLPFLSQSLLLFILAAT